MCQDVFFLFTLTSKTQLRAFPSVISTRFLWTLRVLCALQCACADLVCVSLSLMGAHAGSGWWRQASAVRYGLARRLPRGGHDLISSSRSTFTDLIPFHALFETIQLPCLLLVTFSSHGSERSPGRPGFAAEGPKRSEGVSQPEPRRPHRRRAVLGWTSSAEDRRGPEPCLYLYQSAASCSRSLLTLSHYTIVARASTVDLRPAPHTARVPGCFFFLL